MPRRERRAVAPRRLSTLALAIVVVIICPARTAVADTVADHPAVTSPAVAPAAPSSSPAGSSTGPAGVAPSPAQPPSPDTASDAAPTHAPDAAPTHASDAAPTHASDAAPTYPVIVARAGQPAADKANTEVVSLLIVGNKPWQRLAVDDLDVVLLDSGQRLLPLKRMVRILHAASEEHAGQLTFQFESGPRASVDPATGLLKWNGSQKHITAISRTSEITGQSETYIPASVIAELSGLAFQWNELAYAFHVRTDQPLSIWKVPETPSLLGIHTQRMPSSLPSLRPAAQPPDFSLDFIDVEMRLGAEIIRRDNLPAQAQLSNLEQTFYGQLAGGGYKLRLSQPGVLYDQVDGLRVAEERSDPLRIDYFDWIQAFDGGELALGDSNYGLNDLVFPYVEFTGLRVNGVVGTGWPDDALSSRFSGAMVRPQRFNGIAPVGSHVELFINGQLVNTDEVLTIDPDAPAGFGVWDFQDIRLSPGALNEIRIHVTDPNGVTTQIERDVLGSELLLPKGGVAYLGGIGSRRDRQQMDIGGFFTGGRVLYGATDRLTVGAVVAHQDRFHQFFSPQSTKPVQSTHLGFETFWMPLNPLMIVADVALAMAEPSESGAGDDVAGFLRASYHLSRSLVLGSSLFYYGPHFFNGQTDTPNDRQGAWLSGRWKAARWVSFEAVAGRAQNNVDGQEDRTLYVDFQSMIVRTHPLNGFSLSYNLDRLAPSSGQRARLMHTFEAQASPLPRLDLYAFWAEGDDVILAGQDGGFFDNLNIPTLGLGQTEYKNMRARYALDVGHSVGLDYFQSPGRQRVSFLHDLRTFSRPYLLFHSELGRDLDTATWFFENRTDWRFDRKGDWRLGLRARLEEDQWSVGLFFTITDQFIIHDNGVYRTADTAPDPDLYRGLINPDYGGAIAGSVFIDADADGIRDDNEKGIAGIGVIVGQLDQVTTDKAGRFLVAQLYQSREVRLWLDMETVPAIYTPTHAIQTAIIRPRSLTTINLGITPSHGVTGRLLLRDPRGPERGLSGVRVEMHKADDDSVAAESITAADGSYYLGDLRPGTYRLHIDRSTVPPDVTDPRQMPGPIVIAPADRPVELKQAPIIFTGEVKILPTPRQPDQTPPEPPQILTPAVQVPTAPATEPISRADHPDAAAPDEITGSDETDKPIPPDETDKPIPPDEIDEPAGP